MKELHQFKKTTLKMILNLTSWKGTGLSEKPQLPGKKQKPINVRNKLDKSR